MGNAFLKPKAFKARRGQDSCLDFSLFKLPESGVHISPEWHNLKVTTYCEQLGCPSQAAGPYSCPLGQILDCLIFYGDKGVPGILSLWESRKHKPFWQFSGDVFHTMNCQIDCFSEERLFDFFHEQRLSTDFAQRGIKNFVPGGLYPDQFNLNMGVSGLNLFLDPFTLGKRQHASSCADFQSHGVFFNKNLISSRSWGVVTLIFFSDPSTTVTGIPSLSISAESSVASSHLSIMAF